MENFELKGEWWIPSNPSQVVAGVIKFNPAEMPLLELFGSFGASYSEINNEQIILGIVEKAQPITLLDCLWKSHPIAFSNSPVGSYRWVGATYLAHTIFLGHHFETKESILLSVNRV